MITVQVSKIYYGQVSLRDYQVQEAVDSGEDILVKFEEGHMIIKNHNLNKGKTRTKVKSLFSKQKYNLVDFRWKPFTDELSDGQLPLW